jgi:hypothetical protein
MLFNVRPHDHAGHRCRGARVADADGHDGRRDRGHLDRHPARTPTSTPPPSTRRWPTGRPFLVIFSTPAFCATRTCGPALDIVKLAAADYTDDVAFIHVEPYELQLVEGRAQLVLDDDNRPVVVDAVLEWGLPTEPYIVVVDGDGRVAAKFEGVAAEDEIEAALAQVAR